MQMRYLPQLSLLGGGFPIKDHPFVGQCVAISCERVNRQQICYMGPLSYVKVFNNHIDLNALQLYWESKRFTEFM